MYHANIWGSVCDYRWSLADAHVVCKQLGYPHAKSARYEVDFGRSLGLDIVLDVVACGGDEESLYECEHTAWGVHDREHVEEAGVVCASDQTIGKKFDYAINSLKYQSAVIASMLEPGY